MSWWQRLTGQDKSKSSRPQTAATKTPLEIEILCDTLRPEDFAAVGVPCAEAPKVSIDESNGAYLVYAGRSGATGGFEFAIFFSTGSHDKVYD